MRVRACVMTFTLNITIWFMYLYSEKLPGVKPGHPPPPFPSTAEAIRQFRESIYTCYVPLRLRVEVLGLAFAFGV